MENQDLLKKILEIKDSRLDLLKETLGDSHPLLIHCVVIPSKNAYDIYRFRGDGNKRKNGKWKGFEELVPALQRIDNCNIRVVVINTQAIMFFIFIEDERFNLIGVLFKEKPKQ